MVRVGLLGAGFMGTTHAAAYDGLENAHLVAVADAKQAAADKLAKEHGAQAFYGIEALLDGAEIDMVDVCLPTFLHEQAVVSAARRGKHVLCEKPIALTLEQVDRMIAAVRDAGVMAMIAQVIRFWPQYVVIKDLLEKGELGKPLVATATRLSGAPGWSNWYRDPDLSGGAVLDLHIHDLDYVYSLFGEPRSVYAVGAISETGAWDQVTTSLDYGDKRAVAEASTMMPEGFPFLMAFRLLGTDGCIEYRFRVGGQVDKRDAAETEFTLQRSNRPPEYPSYSDKDGYLAEIEYFVDCVSRDVEPEIATLEQARAVLRIALAARKSLETGRVVEL